MIIDFEKAYGAILNQGRRNIENVRRRQIFFHLTYLKYKGRLSLKRIAEIVFETAAAGTKKKPFDHSTLVYCTQVCNDMEYLGFYEDYIENRDSINKIINHEGKN